MHKLYITRVDKSQRPGRPKTLSAICLLMHTIKCEQQTINEMKVSISIHFRRYKYTILLTDFRGTILLRPIWPNY